MMPETDGLRFKATMELNNINPYVLVRPEQAAHLKEGWRKPLPVRVQINGQPATPWRINLMPVGDGSFYLYLHGEVRTASGTEVGDVVSVELWFDDQYQSGPVHPMPDWFERALERSPLARQSWTELTPSLQKEVLRYFSRLKSPEAEARNLQKAMHVLNGGEGRFLARSWKAGRAQ